MLPGRQLQSKLLDLSCNVMYQFHSQTYLQGQDKSLFFDRLLNKGGGGAFVWESTEVLSFLLV